jgi:predicted AlkP superfamily phosphohydrolase/phosphomutase
MTPARKIVLIGVDAADRDLLREWAHDMTLPNIGAFLSRALVGETVNVEGTYEGSTWPSFYTGVNPGRHGFHNWAQLKPGTYEFYKCRPGTFIKQQPFWEALSAGGRKVAILDVPLSGVSQGLNGIQIVEWGSHDALNGFETWPRQLAAEITTRFGTHPVATSCNEYGRSLEDFRTFRDHLLEGVRRKCALTLHYLESGDWDFFAQVFTEAHCAGHQCWHLHDLSHPNHDADVVSIVGDVMRQVYMEVDRAIGRILASVDDSTVVILLTCHGMASCMGTNVALRGILEKLGFLASRSADEVTRPTIAGRLSDVLRQARHALPDPIRAALRPVLLPIFNGVNHAAAGRATQDPARLAAKFDLARSRCFPHLNGGLVSGIRINVAGREPAGLVQPGHDFDEFCDQLSADLLEVTDKTTGRPLITKVMRAADLFQGGCMDHLPDLLVEWDQNLRVGSKELRDDESCRVVATSPKIGTVEAENRWVRTGNHRPGGFFAAAGAGIQYGTLARTVSIMDFAPTFLQWFGVAGEDLDGVPIEEILAVAPLPA